MVLLSYLIWHPWAVRKLVPIGDGDDHSWLEVKRVAALRQNNSAKRVSSCCLIVLDQWQLLVSMCPNNLLNHSLSLVQQNKNIYLHQEGNTVWIPLDCFVLLAYWWTDGCEGTGDTFVFANVLNMVTSLLAHTTVWEIDHIPLHMLAEFILKNIMFF